ncbi:hypothetical protein GCM10010169_32850 [Micromonospora fulviviridis]|uniref:hypothetical protein n=1 Tax=Micromonospora fulviviridis TaxID=47860 RepID=UPI001663A5C0|nr:hypothetical protein [Micromonospora fulviviridis]GGR85989.1 hypothetical protein GCM10010169_32850 [Micromonospora fulviviridis]
MTGTTTVETRPATTDGGRVGDRIGRVLLGLAAVGAVAAALGAYGTVADAEPAVTVVETWRAYGFVVFAGLFALLALRPRGQRGVWLLVIFHKVAMTVTALAYTRNAAIEGTGTIIAWDGTLSVMLVLAFVLCRGWVAEARR